MEADAAVSSSLEQTFIMTIPLILEGLLVELKLDYVVVPNELCHSATTTKYFLLMVRVHGKSLWGLYPVVTQRPILNFINGKRRQ